MVTYLSKILAVLLIVSAIFFTLFLCPYGVDLTDEAYSIVFGWKLLPLGDRLFADELYNAPRQFDLLNYLLVRPFVSYSVYWIRFSAGIFYSLILTFFCLACFRKKLGIYAGLCFFICSSLFTFPNPWWDYNSWARNMSLLHSSFLVIALRNSNYRKLFVFLSAIMLGLGIIAHSGIFVVFCMTTATLFLWALYKKEKTLWTDILIPYISGTAFILIPNFIYLTSEPTWTSWKYAYFSLSTLGDYTHITPLQKLQTCIQLILRSPEFWISLLAYLFVCWKKAVRHWLTQVLLAAIFVVLCARFPSIANGSRLLKALVGFSFAAGVILIIRAIILQRLEIFLVSITGLTGSLVMAALSAQGKGSIHWMFPNIFIPFFALLLEENETSEGLKLKNLLGPNAVFAVLLLSFFIPSIHRFQTSAARDVPVSQSVRIDNLAPLTGLRTSPRRAFLIKEVYKAVEGKKFVLAYSFLPFVFFFSKARSSFNTTVVQWSAPLLQTLDSLKQMVEKKRFPQVIIRGKSHPGNWGRIPPVPDHGYGQCLILDKFTQCAAKSLISDYDELQIFEVDLSRVIPCVDQVIFNSK